MAAAKLAISVDQALLRRLDALVERRRYPSRSRVIQEAIEEKLARLDKLRLARECAKLNEKTEQALADEGLATEIDEWPEY